jgi:hypothetical protein
MNHHVYHGRMLRDKPAVRLTLDPNGNTFQSLARRR